MTDLTKLTRAQLLELARQKRAGQGKAGASFASGSVPQGISPLTSAEPGLFQQATDALGSGLNSLQSQGLHVLNELSGEELYRDLHLPGLGNVAPFLDRMTGGSPEAPPEWQRLLAARAYQAAPWVGGDVGNQAVESNPVYQRGATQLSDSLGDNTAAYLQSVTQMAPEALMEILGAAATGGGSLAAKVGYTGFKEGAKRALKAGAKGAIASGYTNAAYQAMGAREGQRLDAGLEGLRDPVALGLGAGIGGGAGALGDFRANRDILAELRQEHASRQMQAVTLDPTATAPAPLPLEHPTLMNEPGTQRSTNPGLDVQYLESTKPGVNVADIDATREPKPGTFDFRYEETPAEEAARIQRVTERGDQFLEELRQRGWSPEKFHTKKWDGVKLVHPTEGNKTVGGMRPPPKMEPIDNLPSRAPELDIEPTFMGTRMAPASELPNPKSAEQRNAWKTYADPRMQPKLLTDTVPNHSLGMSGEKTGRYNMVELDQVFPPGAVDMTHPSGPRAMRPADLKRVTGKGPGKKTPAVTPESLTIIQWNRDTKLELDARMKGEGMPARALPIQTVAADLNAVKAYIEANPNAPDLAAAQAAVARITGDMRARGFDPSVRNNVATVETPGLSIQPGGRPQIEVPAAHQTKEFLDKQTRDARGQNWLKETAKKMALPEFRAAPIIAAAIRGVRAANHIENVQVARAFPQLRKAYNEASPAERLTIDTFIKQNLSPEDFKGRGRIPVEVLPEQWRNLFSEGLDQMRSRRDELVRAGYFSPEQVKKMQEMDARGEIWLHRSYKAFVDKKYRPDPDLHFRAAHWLMKHANLSYDEAVAHLHQMVKAPDFEAWRKQSVLAQNVLKSRENIPSILRDVLGEVKDPNFVTASSMGEIERLWRQHKASEALVAPDLKGVMWSDKPVPEMHFEAVWNPNMTPEQNRQTYGQFAGKYLTPQLYEAVIEAPAARVQDFHNGVLGWVAGVFKTAKVAWSPVTYTNNWLSNASNAAAAGLPMWSPRFAPRLVQSARALLAFSDRFTFEGGKQLPHDKAVMADARWVEKAMEYNAIKPGTGAEFGGQQARVIAKEFLRSKRPGPIGWLDAGWNTMQKVQSKMGGIYDGLDQHWRLAAFIEQTTKGVERLNLPLEEAYARAARIVDENFVSSGSVGAAVRGMAGQAGFFAPFLTWHADNLRVHSNWARNSLGGFKSTDAAGKKVAGVGHDLNSGEGSGRAFNVAMHYGILAGLGTGLRYLMGMSDEDVKLGEASLKEGQRTTTPSAMREWLPWRDDKGRLQFVSLSPLNPSAVFLKGDPKASLLSRIFVNTVSGFTQSGALDYPTQKLLAAGGMAEDPYSQELLPGQEGAGALMDIAWKIVEPGLVRDMNNIARRTGVVGHMRKYEEPLTWAQAAMRVPLPGNPLASIKPEPVGPRSQLSEQRRERGEKMETRANLRQVRGTPMDTDERERLIRAVRAKRDENALKRSQRSTDVRGGQ